MILLKKNNYLTFLLLFVFFNNINSFATTKDTTRQKSTAGAGVASFLIDESTILNPAPLAFFNISSVFYSNNTLSGDSITDSGDWSIIASDTTQGLKGSISYFNSHTGTLKEKQWGFAIAKPMGKSSAIGLSYLMNKTTNLGIESKYNFATVGIIHSLNQNFSLGIVFNDPVHNSNFTKVISGLQYIFKDSIVIMIDFGTNFRKDMNKTFLYRSAIQVKLLSSFYLRYGISKDDFLLNKTSGFGISWIGPKTNIDFGIRNVTDRSSLKNDYKETSFSGAIKF